MACTVVHCTLFPIFIFWFLLLVEKNCWVRCAKRVDTPEDETEGVCCLDSGPWRIFPTPRFIYGTVIPVIPVTVPRHRSYLLSAAEVHPSDRVTNATVSGAHPSPSNPLPPPPPSSLFRSQPERRESRTASTITPSSRPSPAMFAGKFVQKLVSLRAKTPSDPAEPAPPTISLLPSHLSQLVTLSAIPFGLDVMVVFGSFYADQMTVS